MTQEFVTDAGKTIDFIIDKKTAHVKVQFSSGGQLPDSLSGLFTTVREAKKAVIIYLSNKNKETVEEKPTQQVRKTRTK